MTFRRNAAACLSVVLLSQAGCSDGDTSAQGGHVPSSPEIVVLLNEAEQALASGQMAVAAKTLGQAVERSPDDPAPWVAIARLRLRAGEHLTALEAADRAIALGPDHPPALFVRALFVRDAHGFTAAKPWFEAALTADPLYVDAWAEYAGALGDGGEASAMLAAVRKLAELAPRDPRVPYLQAVLAARGGQYTLARSLLSRSGMAERGVPAAVQLDAVISLAEGNADSAAATLELLAMRLPGNARVRELLAKALFDAGRLDELLTRFGPETRHPEASPYLMMLLGRAHEQFGDRAAAAPLLERATRGASNAPGVLAVRDGLPPPTEAARATGQSGEWGTARADAKVLSDRFPFSSDVGALVGDVMLGAGDPQAALDAYAIAARIKRPWPLTRKMALAYKGAGDAAASDALIGRHLAGEPNNASALKELAKKRSLRGEWADVARLLDQAMMLGAGHDHEMLGLRLRAAKALGQDGEALRFAALLAEIHPRPLAQQ